MLSGSVPTEGKDTVLRAPVNPPGCSEAEMALLGHPVLGLSSPFCNQFLEGRGYGLEQGSSFQMKQSLERH